MTSSSSIKFHQVPQLHDKLPLINSHKKPLMPSQYTGWLGISNHFIIILGVRVFIHCFQTKQALGKLTIDDVCIEGFKGNN